ncbi:metal-dependent hydrolase [Hyperthermus butylicus]|uniref:Membrane-bound metal-dependent hydrolase n=1 Tax=Hyperthermus butylicus (strain DSM 5456 / JCM 9403 / PLM1-5) TaxID=415426 RepID=A2BN14_HYPBU|nr:metal-dependent hydrolase [Hyperthermus butylicus]ABM81375.1 hypothetical protein Hbut_1554 [Hyperthermus butylicus DSM 5456]
MQKQTHVAFSLALASTAAVLLSYTVYEYVVAIVAAIVSSVLPDLDLYFRHRMALHNVNVFLVLALTAYTILSPFGHTEPVIVGLAAGYLGHILLDMFTVRGVAFMYPLTSRRLRLARLRSSSTVANTAITVASLLIFAYSSLSIAVRLVTMLETLLPTP